MNELEKLCAQVAIAEDRQVAANLNEASTRDAFMCGAARLVEKEPARSGFRWTVAAAFFAVAVAAALLMVLFHGTAPKESGSEQWVRAANGRDRTIGFSDGSKVVLKNGAHARIRSQDEDTRTVSLESGTADIRVVHAERTRWLVLAGPFRVQVIGTAFSVSWTPEEERFAIALAEGEVTVTGPMIESGQKVRAGHRLVALVGKEQVAFARTDAVRSDARPASGTVAPEDTAALEDLPPASLKERALREVTPDGLLKNADAARLSGNMAEAEKRYLQLRSRYPRSGHAATAAFDLGRMAFDQSRDFRKAVHWFEIYLAERKGGTLERETLGRLMEAQRAAGMKAPAKKTAADYLKRYPDGPHVRRAREIALE